MNQEMPMEKELSSEGQKIEAIINEAESFVQEGEEQLEALPEGQREVLEFIKDKKFEFLSPQIIEKLGGMLEMAMPER
jgi:hypothetical protein